MDAQNSTHAQNSTRERVEQLKVTWREPQKRPQYGTEDVGACVKRIRRYGGSPKKGPSMGESFRASRIEKGK
jgi:hypothetical protein